MLLRLLLALATFLLVALLVAYLAWHIGRQMGHNWMLAFWPVAATVVAGVMAWRMYHAQGSAMPFQFPGATSTPFLLFLPMWGVAIGGMMLPLCKAIREPEIPFDTSLAFRCLGAFLLGVVAFFSIYLVLDLRALLARLA